MTEFEIPSLYKNIEAGLHVNLIEMIPDPAERATYLFMYGRAVVGILGATPPQVANALPFAVSTAANRLERLYHKRLLKKLTLGNTLFYYLPHVFDQAVIFDDYKKLKELL